LSASGVLKPDMVERMGKGPLILALANPNPEIMPEDAKAAATTRHVHRPLRLSEPGQQCPVFPLYLPRRARCRGNHHQRGNEARGRRGHRGLAQEEPSDVAARAYSGKTETFGPNYLIPSPFDQR
jgi:malate dehydrogenase (oxaloacetate-decarboxylating)(NADP+)